MTAAAVVDIADNKAVVIMVADVVDVVAAAAVALLVLVLVLVQLPLWLFLLFLFLFLFSGCCRSYFLLLLMMEMIYHYVCRSSKLCFFYR